MFKLIEILDLSYKNFYWYVNFGDGISFSTNDHLNMPLRWPIQVQVFLI